MNEGVNALSMTEENPHYAKYLKNKDKIHQIVDKKRLKYEKKRLKNSMEKGQQIKDAPYTTDDPYDDNEFLFLNYMTRKYFRDGCIISALKILFGILAISAAIIIIDFHLFPAKIRSIVGTFGFGYGLIMIPLSILYLIAHLICFATYSSFVSTRSSRLSGKIIHFYDKDTDKFAAVNWSNVFSRDKSAFNERRRARGW